MIDRCPLCRRPLAVELFPPRGPVCSNDRCKAADGFMTWDMFDSPPAYAAGMSYAELMEPITRFARQQMQLLEAGITRLVERGVSIDRMKRHTYDDRTVVLVDGEEAFEVWTKMDHEQPVVMMGYKWLRGARKYVWP